VVHGDTRTFRNTLQYLCTQKTPMQFHSREEHLSHLYDACKLILDTYRETDLFSVYSNEGLEDHINFAATAREIMGLIAEGDLK